MSDEELLKVIDKGLESLLKEPTEVQQAFGNGCRYTMNVFQSATKYWEKIERENQKYKEVIDKAINDLNIIIDIVREQPLGSDCWIIDRLEANKSILKEVE